MAKGEGKRGNGYPMPTEASLYPSLSALNQI